MYKEFVQQLTSFMNQEDIKTEEPMKKHTTFRVGGPAKFFLNIRSEEILRKVLALVRENSLPYFVLGNGSNLLVSDEGYDGIILYLGDEFSQIEIKEKEITAGAAAYLGKVAKSAMEAGLSGMEFAAGIPGSLGGGVVMNAGAYGGELSQVVTSVRAMNTKGDIVILKKNDLMLGYRTSIFKQQPFIILGVTMELQNGKKEEIKDKIMRYNQARKEKQPLEYPSAGSTFKRPEGYFAGELIMNAGLRGYQIGGAQVSEKHCGFVINKGGATAADVKQLIAHVQDSVKNQFGVDLEPEVIII